MADKLGNEKQSRKANPHEQAQPNTGEEEEDLAWLVEWGKAYEQEQHRTVTKTIRFREDEWEMVEKRANRADMAPATFVRLMAMGMRPDLYGDERARIAFCGLARRLLDLITKNPTSVAHLAEAQHLSTELEGLHAKFCYRHRAEDYPPPPGLGSSP